MGITLIALCGAALFGACYFITECFDKFQEPKQLELAFIRDERIQKRPWLLLADGSKAFACTMLFLGTGYLIHGLASLPMPQITTYQGYDAELSTHSTMVIVVSPDQK